LFESSKVKARGIDLARSDSRHVLVNRERFLQTLASCVVVAQSRLKLTVMRERSNSSQRVQPGRANAFQGFLKLMFGFGKSALAK
jgi:hypothetical protein